MLFGIRKEKLIAEAIGTSILVFFGTGAIVIDALSNGTITHLGIGLTFGLAVLAMIYAIGPISGAHINPAVTIGFWSAGRIRKTHAILYIAAQIAGALAASLLLALLFGTTAGNLGATIPSGAWHQSLILEFVLTLVLMFVVMGVAHDERAEGLMAGVAVGAVVAMEAIVGGPISGASMNPARSLAPGLVSGVLSGQWIYWAGPILGSVAGAQLFRMARCQTEVTKKNVCC